MEIDRADVIAWQLHPAGVIVRTLDDGAAVFHQGSGDVYVLSRLHGEVLEHLAAGRGDFRALLQFFDLDTEPSGPEDLRCKIQEALYQVMSTLESMQLVGRVA
ncbi:hypothetical protein [Ectothiorhodospira lacustris]|uniref:hypothetical protein n=1 Tax=Ectothiorhodospira lacustris TaxID=2899127 RepID=UPI001EE8BCFD|nr:hypothetical protein [Ectothiorhodospira lacustris]MCG5510368.1 hypothetical protein [Ectothiorhodospira lacustris]MCG5522114.1 hypothetical protein [Ectothiorhodospira lacustris]